MKGIIIAAGLGSRMGAFTDERPKCLLPIAGRTLIDRTVENLRAAGCHEIVIIRGHKGHMIDVPDVVYVENTDFQNNNILHSLMYARHHLEGEVLVSYSDIWVEPWIHQRLIETRGDIVIAVDRDWMPYYANRQNHPIPEAENVYYAGDGTVVEIGKHLDAETDRAQIEVGEFLGLWRMSAVGTEAFRLAFEDLEAKTNPLAPFQRAAEWRKAYITDIAQYLVGSGHRIDCALIERGWAELDTDEDYLRLPEIADRQKLTTLSHKESEK